MYCMTGYGGRDMQYKTKTSTREPLPIKWDLQRAGITQMQVARAARVHFTVVSAVLARRGVSANVIRAAERLLERKTKGRAWQKQKETA